MKLAVITVNYNGGEMIVQTLKSLFACTRVLGDELQQEDVFVVDNGSSDDSLAALKAAFPGVNYFETGENLGFGSAHNYFFEKVFAGEYKDYDYFLSINPDIEFTDGWLAPLISAAEKSSLIAAVNPAILYRDQFWQFDFTISNPDIYLHHDDYRFLAPVVGDPHAEFPTKEIVIKGKHFIRPSQREFKVLLNTDYEAIELETYDESLNGYVFKLGRAENYAQSALSTFVRKVFYKCGWVGLEGKIKDYKISLKEAKLPESPIEIVNSFGAGFRFDNLLPENHYYGQDATELPEEVTEVELFHGAVALLRADVIKKLGGFDRDFFMYYEESDLAMQMRAAGYKIKAQPKSRVYHLERGTRSQKVLEFMQNSQKLFVNKWSDTIVEMHAQKRVANEDRQTKARAHAQNGD